VIKVFCDLCNGEIKGRGERYVLNIANHEGKPALPEIEMCPVCKEDVKAFLQTYNAKGVK